MDLGNPIQSIISAAQGPVLEILARTDTPLTGRTIAALVGGRVSQSQVSRALRELVKAGVVLRTEHPPAHLFLLNRDHVAAEAIQQLASLRETLVQRIRDHIASWEIPPESVWLFGSFARGEGDTSSDIDVLVLRPGEVEREIDQADIPYLPGQTWIGQVDGFTDAVNRWSGNDCRVVELSGEEFKQMLERDDRLAVEIVRDGVLLAGEPLTKPGKLRNVGSS